MNIQSIMTPGVYVIEKNMSPDLYGHIVPGLWYMTSDDGRGWTVVEVRHEIFQDEVDTGLWVYLIGDERMYPISDFEPEEFLEPVPGINRSKL